MHQAMAKVQTRTFSAHQDLILSVIRKQAGTLAKAAMEGVMNAVDAGASEINVSLHSGQLVIEDNGKGFESEDSIKEVFEVFGSPHETDAEGFSTDAKYGTFRIGRGQLFAFGSNVWQTNTFEMRTDINTKGLEYELHTGVTEVRGCRVRVDLYDLSLIHISEPTRPCR
jgi:hypothetical protein